MKQYNYSLAQVYIGFLSILSVFSAFISFRLYSQEKILYAVVFLALSIALAVLSTYKKKVLIFPAEKRLEIYRLFAGFAVSSFSVTVSKDSDFTINSVSLFGRATSEGASDLTLVVNGFYSKNGIKEARARQIDIVSEHIDSRKRDFQDKSIEIANRMGFALNTRSLIQRQKAG